VEPKPDFDQIMQARVSVALTTLAVALLFVGAVSGTVLRHVVQITPIVCVLLVLRRKPDWGAYGAIPIFVFWIGIVILIWLFLLGLSRIANGHYTLAEVLATVVMAGAALTGLGSSLAVGKELRVGDRVIAIGTFAVFQFAAMWVSFLGPIANR